MARLCGIRLGERAFEVLVVDGSTKKPKVRFALEGRVPTDPEFAREELGENLRELAKEHRKALTVDDTSLALDAGVGVYRSLSLPFAERSKIEEVIKFEVESEIPQWDIEDLVCDFHVLESSPVESKLIVTGVPKDVLGESIAAATRAGLEPIEVELETTALYHAAEFADLLTPEASQLLVHFGERSTSIVAVTDGRIASMRAMHLELVSEAHAESEGDEEPLDAPLPPPDPERQAAVRSRIQREFVRMLTSRDSGPPFDAICVCGRVPEGLIGSDVAGVRVVALDPLAEVEPERDEAQRLRLALAFATAWRQMGGGSLKPHLRREELAFAGTFERLELPLGVLGLLLVTYLASQLIITKKELQPRADDVSLWMQATRNFTVGEPEKGDPGLIANPSTDLANVVRTAVTGGYDDQMSPVEQFDTIRGTMLREIDRLKKQLGTSKDLSQPMSALTATTAVLDVFDEMGEEGLGRFAIRRLESQYRPSSGGRTQEYVNVKLDLSFFAETDLVATRRYNDLVAELQAKPWCIEVDTKATESFKGQNVGIATNGLEIRVDVWRIVPQARDTASAAASNTTPERG